MSSESTESAPFVIDDEALFKENNTYLVLDKPQKGYEIVYEFIKWHPINTAFTKVVQAPKDRLIRFWRTMDFPTENGYFTIQGDLGTEEQSDVVTFNMESVNDALRWRLKEHYPWRISHPKDLKTLATDFGEFGVKNASNISKMSDVTKNKFPLIYQFFFSLIHKCLTGKVGSTDQLGLPHLLIMLNLMNGDEFNLGHHIIHAIKDSYKKDSGHLAYIRFLSILVGEECARKGYEIVDPVPIRACNIVFKGSLTGWELDDTKLSPNMLAAIPMNNVKRAYLGLEIPEQEPAQGARSHAQSAASHIRGKLYTILSQ